MPIDYDHSRNGHALPGPQAALSLIFPENKPISLLDVGCGTGTWLRAAKDVGINDLFGIDGVEVSPEHLHVPKELIRHHDLTLPLDLGRTFEAVLCLEVAEHLDANCAETLIDALVKHGEVIYFSAACPRQIGQHHVNCQWPDYWQRLFNDRGFACEDSLRWKLWDDPRIEPWYKQNIFVARRAPKYAGHEPRIMGIVHPEIFATTITILKEQSEHFRQIKRGFSFIKRNAHPFRVFKKVKNRLK
jgi:SAM-dependent methyltransferase